MDKKITHHGVFWITLDHMDIEIEYYVYGRYTKAFANYYYAGEDSITGAGKGRTRKIAIKKAIKHLLDQRIKKE